MSALAAIADLRRAANLLAESGVAPGERVAAGMETYISEFSYGGKRLDECLGLVPASGGRTWPELERLSERDRLIVRIAEAHFAGIEPARAAKAMVIEWSRYLRNAHGADRRRGYSIAEPGSLRAMFFEAIVLGDLPGERRLADVLRTSETVRLTG